MLFRKVAGQILARTVRRYLADHRADLAISRLREKDVPALSGERSIVVGSGPVAYLLSAQGAPLVTFRSARAFDLGKEGPLGGMARLRVLQELERELGVSGHVGKRDRR